VKTGSIQLVAQGAATNSFVIGSYISIELDAGRALYSVTFPSVYGT